MKISVSPWVFAAEAFLSGWEIVSKYVPEVFIEDFGFVSTPLEQRFDAMPWVVRRKKTQILREVGAYFGLRDHSGQTGSEHGRP